LYVAGLFKPQVPSLQPHVVVEPAGDRVAAEPDDAAAVAVDLGRQDRVDPVQNRGQFLGATLCAQGERERLGEQGEASDIGA